MAARVQAGQRRSPLLPCLLLLLSSPSFVAPWKPAARTSRLALRAEDPVATLREVVTKSLKRSISKGGIKYSVRSGSEEEGNVTACVKLHCMKREPRFVGKAAPTLQESQAGLAKRLLEDPKFLISLILDEEPKAKKKANKRKEESAELKQGDNVSGAPKTKAKKKEKTKAAGGNVSAVRPKGEVLVRHDLPSSEWFEGSVAVLGQSSALVDVEVPGEEKPVRGDLKKEQFSPGLWKEAAVNSLVRVRKLDFAPGGFLTLTMRDEESFLDASKLAPGQEVNGTVQRVFMKDDQILGLFLDIGAARVAFMPIDQLNDGLPSSNPSMRRIGRTLSVRILSVGDDGKITVTRRSGELCRPVVKTLTNKEEALTAYSSEKFFEGEVVRMTLTKKGTRAVWVRLAPEGLPEIVGRLPLGNASKSLPQEVYLGQKLKVRVASVIGAKVFFSMKEEGEEEEAPEATAEEEKVRAEEEPATEAKAEVQPKEEEEAPTTATATTTKKPDDVFGSLFR